MENSNNSTPSSSTENDTSTSSSLFQCPRCLKVFLHESSLSRHKSSAHGENQFKCSSCHKTYDRKDSLHRHIKNGCKGNEKPRFICKKCLKEFPKKWHLQRHVQNCKSRCSKCRNPLGDNPQHHICQRLLNVKWNRKPKQSKITANSSSHTTTTTCETYEIPPNWFDTVNTAMLITLESMDLATTQPTMATSDNFIAMQEELELFEQNELVDFQIEQPPNNSLVSSDADCQRRNAESHAQRRYAKTLVTGIKKECGAMGSLPTGTLPRDIMKLMVKYLNLGSEITIKPKKGTLTSYETRYSVWQFWHDNSQESTLTTDLVSLRYDSIPRVQTDLAFMSSVVTITKRRKQFYQAIWKTTVKTYRELISLFRVENPTIDISWGTFTALKPFYVHHATQKDLVMCCCKIHLHIRWAVEAIVKCLKKQHIDFPAGDYCSFFELLYADCPKEENTYISWTCTPDKEEVCDHVESNWQNIQASITSKADANTTVLFTEFKKVQCFGKDGKLLLGKDGKPLKRLVPTSNQVNVQYLVDFIDDILPGIIHHRNMLNLHRSINKEFKELFSVIVIDNDFSENLTLGIKFEPQSLHWHKRQLSIHSGLVKCEGNKTYHPYVSNDRTHDQAFVKVAIEKMMENTVIPEGSIIIESDNCSSQYKSTQHFFDMQDIANKSDRQIIRIYGVAGHGKGEVDNVGGVAKVAVRRDITRGKYYADASEVVSFLEEKFGEKTSPDYVIEEIYPQDLLELRKAASRKTFKSTEGSSAFHVIIFTPKAATMKASNRLCICTDCQNQIGSCSLYEEHNINYEDIHPAQLRSTVLSSVEEEVEDCCVDEFITKNSFVAVAAPEKDSDTVWFIKVIELNCISSKIETDDYDHDIPPGTHYMKGHFLERLYATKSSIIYKLDEEKVTFFYKETIIFPYVNVKESKKGLEVDNNELTDIICHAEQTGFAHL